MGAWDDKLNLTCFEPLQLRALLDARDLPPDRRLRGVGEDPGGEAAARAGDRAGEGLGAARPRRRRLSRSA